MKEGNVVYLLVGQRGSGKSHYAKQLIEKQPELSAVSRDEILIRLCGSTHADPYSGVHFFAYQIMHRLLRRKLSTQKELSLILDMWTESSRDRKRLIRTLKEYGATRVVALYFTTPVEVVSSWFWKKPGIAKMKEMRTRQGEELIFFSEDAPARDHKLFHKLASHIDSDGFDEVIRIDPSTLLL